MKWSSHWILPPRRGWTYLLYIWILLYISGGCCAEEENPRIVEHPSDHYVARNDPAKLLCKAEGDPPPNITWYRNGEKVVTNLDDPASHRLILPTELFFLRIIHTKTQKPDVGTYYCNATNIHGSAISRNATLHLAVIREDFRENPQSVTVPAGETATFRCGPPKGEPEPRVLWLKDGENLNLDNRISVTLDGYLTIASVKVSDAGKYTCMARNPAGDKLSAPATLTVLEKPTFNELPDDIQANVDNTVELKCRASGDPLPTIQWKREEGRIPFGRARQLDDGTLRIEKVQVVDEGVYVCVAENSAGTVEAVGRLSVQTHPSYLIAPKDLSVGRGRTAIMQCVVTGNPDPTLFWAKGTEQQLLFPKQSSGRYTVSSDGTLRIANVEYRDAGTYVCQALNTLASAKSSATLTVTDDDDRPPPIIIAGPQNQTLEPKEVALLTCQAEGQPTPSIRWYKDNKSIIATDPRVTLLNSGTLQISDLKLNDSGVYTCKAISETGETDWSATLKVAKQGPYQRNQKESSVPGAPSKPKVSDVADTSVHLTWTPNDEMGQSPVYAYVVEYFTPQMAEQGWKVATDSVSRDGYTVKDLLPATKYIFYVRAKNSFGVSPPSPLSDVITTREKRKTFTVNMPRDEIVKELNLLNLELKSGEGINSTAIRVKWEVATSLASIEGYIINYTEVELVTDVHGKSEIIKITDPYQFRSYITDLRPNSWYLVCIKAYARDVTSRCSNSIKVPTKESVPKSPPEKVVIHRDGHSIHIRWLPPPKPEQNGEIKGYDIYCMSEDNNSNCSTSASGSDSSAVIKNVDIDGTYRIKIAARTKVGRGVWSSDQVLGPEQTNIVSEPWFIWMLVGTIGGTLWLALCVFTIWLCRRRRRNKKKMSQNGMYSAVPVHKSDESTRGGNVLTREDVMYSQKDGNIHTAYSGLQSDLASLLDCGHKDGLDGSQVYSSATSMPQMKTFYQRPGQPPSSSVAPYATTTLINKGGNSLTRPGPNSVGDSGFRPINHAYVHSSASGSGDSCQKPDMRSSDSNTDNSRPNTGHYSYAAGCPHDHCEGLVSPSSDSGSLTTDENGMSSKRNKYSKIGGCSSCGQGKPPLVNWAELLPPPPEHPPHSEGGPAGDSSGGDCSLHRHNTSNMAETRFMDNRSAMSPVSKISACSCPVPHDRMHLRANIPYSELDYPTHSCPLVPRYHGDMSGYPEGSGGSGGGGSGSSNYNSDRPYSPKPLNTNRPQASDILMHRCQSPRSCHNCGSSLSQPPGSLQPSSSSSSSSYNAHIHHHHPLQPEAFVTLSQRPPCLNDITDQRVGMYPPMGAYPQGGANGLATSFTQTAAGQCPFNPNYPPAALHGYRIPPMELSDQRNSSDLEQLQGRMYPAHDGPHVDRACQSSLPSLAGQCLQGGFRRSDSPTSEGVPDYAGESDMDVHRATDCHTPDSSVNGDGGSISDTDFASAVARAAELSGLTVVGTTVTDPKNSNTKKYRKHRAPPRAQSPYSTDSNMSAVVHKPYPKSERKKQLQDQARKYGQRKESSMQEMEIIEADPNSMKT